MALAKYAEEINEVVFERMDEMTRRRSTHIEIIASIPVAVRKPQGAPTVGRADRPLFCKDCGELFLFTTGEQRFYHKNGLNHPKRCPACRKKIMANRRFFG